MSKVIIGLIGDKVKGYLPHESAEKTLSSLFEKLDTFTEYEWLPSEKITIELIEKYDLIWVGSGPYLNEEKVLIAIQYVRENDIPVIGTCSGFKYMIIEYAKNVLKATNPFEYISRNENCSRESKELSIELKKGSTLVDIYNSPIINEISHCTYQIAPAIFQKMSEEFEFCGKAQDGRTVLIQLPCHPFYVAALFLPQLKSNSKLILAWLKLVIKPNQSSPSIS